MQLALKTLCNFKLLCIYPECYETDEKKRLSKISKEEEEEQKEQNEESCSCSICKAEGTGTCA